jgi:hypothetical protein
MNLALRVESRRIPPPANPQAFAAPGPILCLKRHVSWITARSPATLYGLDCRRKSREIVLHALVNLAYKNDFTSHLIPMLPYL